MELSFPRTFAPNVGTKVPVTLDIPFAGLSIFFSP